MTTRALRSAGLSPALESVYGIVDSKMMFVEYQTRKLLHWLFPVEKAGERHTETVAPIFSPPTATIGENDPLFERLESLSRSIYWLEQFKLSLRDDNAMKIMELLDNDAYLATSECRMEEILNGDE